MKNEERILYVMAVGKVSNVVQAAKQRSDELSLVMSEKRGVASKLERDALDKFYKWFSDINPSVVFCQGTSNNSPIRDYMKNELRRTKFIYLDKGMPEHPQIRLEKINKRKGMLKRKVDYLVIKSQSGLREEKSEELKQAKKELGSLNEEAFILQKEITTELVLERKQNHVDIINNNFRT